MENKTQYTYESNDNNGRPISKESQMRYIGDVKWVLYQYICDLNNSDITIVRCGNYAYDKINKLGEKRDNKVENRYINGEHIIVLNIPKLDKKQIILSKYDEKFLTETYVNDSAFKNDNTTIYPDDIVLYFA